MKISDISINDIKKMFELFQLKKHPMIGCVVIVLDKNSEVSARAGILTDVEGASAILETVNGLELKQGNFLDFAKNADTNGTVVSVSKGASSVTLFGVTEIILCSQKAAIFLSENAK